MKWFRLWLFCGDFGSFPLTGPGPASGSGPGSVCAGTDCWMTANRGPVGQGRGQHKANGDDSRKMAASTNWLRSNQSCSPSILQRRFNDAEKAIQEQLLPSPLINTLTTHTHTHIHTISLALSHLWKSAKILPATTSHDYGLGVWEQNNRSLVLWSSISLCFNRWKLNIWFI